MTIINPFPGPWEIQQPPIIIPGPTKVVHHHHYHTPSQPRFKATRAGTKASHVVVVLDDSSSMQSCRIGTISGFNEFVAGQRIDAEQTGLKTYISLVKFNGREVTTVIDRIDVKQVEPLTQVSYNPSGSTNLLDAMGMTISRLNESIKRYRKRDRDSLILAILTDGEENTSQSYNNEKIKMMIEECEDKNWGFMFLGANIDAFATASNWGFREANTLQYNTTNMTESFAAATRSTNTMKAAYSAGVATCDVYDTSAFTDDERDDAGK